MFRELNALKTQYIVVGYALGGATAVLFYAEPTRTYDLDVFVCLASRDAEPLARQQGFAEESEQERHGFMTAEQRSGSMPIGDSRFGID